MESKIVITLKTSKFRNLYLIKEDGTLDMRRLMLNEKKFHELYAEYLKNNVDDFFEESFFQNVIVEDYCNDIDRIEHLTKVDLKVSRIVKATDPFTHKDDLWEEEVKL